MPDLQNAVTLALRYLRTGALSPAPPDSRVIGRGLLIACCANVVARIRHALRNNRLVVSVAGALAAGDMRRLEHACAPALTTRVPPLTIDLRRVTALDATAAAILDRLARRGVTLVKSREVAMSLGIDLIDPNNRSDSRPPGPPMRH